MLTEVWRLHLYDEFPLEIIAYRGPAGTAPSARRRNASARNPLNCGENFGLRATKRAARACARGVRR